MGQVGGILGAGVIIEGGPAPLEAPELGFAAQVGLLF